MLDFWVSQTIGARVRDQLWLRGIVSNRKRFREVSRVIGKILGRKSKIFANIYSWLCSISPSGSIYPRTLIELVQKPPYSISSIEAEIVRLVIGYGRVSSREQAENTNALAQQIERLWAYGVNEVYYDIQTGRKDNRPQWQIVIRLAREGKLGTLVLTRIDRLTRSLVTLRKIIQELQKYDVNLVILDQKLDLSTPQGKLMLNMLGLLAEWEVDLLSERVQHGKRHQRSQRWANASCPWGYQVIDRQYVLDQTPFLCLLSDRPDNYKELSQVTDPALLPGRTIAELARDCINLFLEFKGIRRALKAIFAKYGLAKTSAKFNGTDKVFHWTLRGFSLWLNNPVLDGHTAYLQYVVTDGKRVNLPKDKWQLIPDTHPEQRLLREGEAVAIETIIQANSSKGRGCFQTNGAGSDNYRPFAYQIGLVYCGECGSRCTSKGSGSKAEYLYYACRHAGLGCTNHQGVRRQNIEQALIEALVEKSQSLSQSDIAIVDPPAEQSGTLARLETQLAALEQIPGFNPDIDDLKQKLQQQIADEKNPFLSVDKVCDRSVEELIRAGNNLAIWHLLSNDEKVEIYPKLVKKIYLRDGQVASVVFNQ
jgi:site-specific DNA recombinase